MTLSGQLATLEGSGLIRLATTQPQLEYAFRHALIHEAAYQSLLREDRRTLHRAAGEVLEELFAGRIDEAAGMLAYHFARAEVTDKAVIYQLQAADRAAASYANAEAIELYQAALAGVTAASQSPEMIAAAEDRLGGVLELVGRIDEAIDAYTRASALTPPDAILDRARLSRRRANAHRVVRRVPESRAAFTEATELLDAVQTMDRGRRWWSERIDLLLERAWLHYFWGSIDEMGAVLVECGPAIEPYAGDAQRARYYGRMCLLTMRRRHMMATDEALAYAEAAYDAWDATGEPTDVELARFQAGFCRLWAGDVDGAVHYLRESLGAAELTGDVVLQSRCLMYLAVAARFRGDPDEMERLQAQAAPIVAAGGLREYEAMAAGNRAWAAWRRGDRHRARAEAAEALRISRELPVALPIEFMVRLPMLVLDLEEGGLDEAMSHVDQLIDQAWIDETYGRTLQEARAAYEAGSSDRAREHLLAVVEQAKRAGRL